MSRVEVGRERDRDRAWVVCTCFSIDVCLFGLGEGGLVHCELNSIGCDTITVKL
jgi:hypothetical protein